MLFQNLKNSWSEFRRNSPIWFAIRILNRLPKLPIDIRIFYFFKFTGIDKSKLTPHFPGEIKWGDADDLSGAIEFAGSSKSSLFLQRVQNGDKLLSAINTDGKTIGYGWVCLKNVHIEDITGCRFTFPKGALYAYNFYIDPDYRLHGIWVGFMQLILSSSYYDPTQGLYCFVNYGNSTSLKPHFRYGFHLYSRKVILSLLGHPFAFDKPIIETEQIIQDILAEG